VRFLRVLSCAVFLAFASPTDAATISPIAQDRSVSVWLRESGPIVTCMPFGSYTKRFCDEEVAAGFGLFSATAVIDAGQLCGCGSDPSHTYPDNYATQESSIGEKAIYASGTHNLRARSNFVCLSPPQTVKYDIEVESRFSVSFELDEATPFRLVGSLYVFGGYTSGLTIPTNGRVTLTGPGGVIVEIERHMRECGAYPDPNCPLDPLTIDEQGILQAGIYTLEAVIDGGSDAYPGPGGWYIGFDGDASFDVELTIEFVCGDGVLDPLEECDDGNTENGDGCSALCMSEAPVPSVPWWGLLLFGVLLGGILLVMRRRGTSAP